MKSLKLILITGTIISSNQLTAMHPDSMSAIAGKGALDATKKPANTSRAPWAGARRSRAPEAGDLRASLTQQDKDQRTGSGSSSSDSSASPERAATGDAAPATALGLATGSPIVLTPTVPAAPVSSPATSPRSCGLFADAEVLVTGSRRSPSPVACGAGSGAGASDDGYDSDKSIRGAGTLLPKLGSINVVYRRSALKEACMRESTHFFDAVVGALKEGKKPLSSEVDKAVADAQEFPNRYPIKRVIELNQLLDSNKFVPSKEAQGSLYNILNQAKIKRAEEIAKFVEEKTAELREIKKAEYSVAERYSMMNGPCHSSPKGPYGMGRKFFDPVAADLAAVGQSVKISQRAPEGTSKHTGE